MEAAIQESVADRFSAPRLQLPLKQNSSASTQTKLFAHFEGPSFCAEMAGGLFRISERRNFQGNFRVLTQSAVSVLLTVTRQSDYMSGVSNSYDFVNFLPVTLLGRPPNVD